MEPNESTQGRAGERITLSGDYRAACCNVVVKLAAGQSFPNCSEHGETVWTWIPPFVQGDYGMAALLEQWKHVSRTSELHNVSGFFNTLMRGWSSAPIPVDAVETTIKPLPEILIQAAIIVPGDKVTDGVVIEAVAPAWFEILKQLERDPEFLYSFSKTPRKFEELIAGAYEQDGYEVILTPPSSDKGRDVIASKPGFVSVRFIDQAKAYTPNHRVTANDVRAMIGVLTLEQNVSKGIVTTTSQFAPGIEKDENIKRLVPFRLELRDGKRLRDWLLALYKPKS
jgi:restriction system protein